MEPSRQPQFWKLESYFQPWTPGCERWFFPTGRKAWQPSVLGAGERQPQEAKGSQGHHSWQLSSGRNPLMLTVLEGINQIYARGSWWKKKAVSPRKESLATQRVIGNWKAARSPRPARAVIPGHFHLGAIQECFRSQNPTFSWSVKMALSHRKESPAPVSCRQVRSAPQETKASSSHRYRQLSSGRNPWTFPVLGGGIPLLYIGTWLWTQCLFSIGRKAQQHSVSWAVERWPLESKASQSHQCLVQMSVHWCAALSPLDGWEMHVSFLCWICLGFLPFGCLCILDFATI